MAESKNARRERIAAQVFAVLAAQPNDLSYSDDARKAMLAAAAFIKAFDAAYGQPAKARQIERRQRKAAETVGCPVDNLYCAGGGCERFRLCVREAAKAETHHRAIKAERKRQQKLAGGSRG